MLGKSACTLFDEKQLIADIQNEKINALDLSATWIKDEKAEMKKTATLSGHNYIVSALTVLPDGRLASGSRDNTIRLWDVPSGKSVVTLSGHSNTVYALAALPDGRLASGSWDNTIRLWDVPSGQCVAILYGHMSSVCALAVLPDGHLASGSWDTTIRLWEVKSQKCVAILRGHEWHINALVVLPDGRLASGSNDYTIRLWEVKSGKCVATLIGHADRIWTLAVLPDGRLASGSIDKTIRLWEVDSGKCVATLREPIMDSVCVLKALPDGRLASGSIDRAIRLWEVQSGQCVGSHASDVNALTVLPDGRLVSGSYDSTVCLWDVGLSPIPLPALQKVLMPLQSNTSVRQVNLRHTLLNDGSVAGLAQLFQTNRTATELHMAHTQVTAKGAWDFYTALSAHHPLREGLRHEAMGVIYCKDILEKFFPRPLIGLMMDYVAPEEAKRLRDLDSAINASAELLAKERAKLHQTLKRKREDSGASDKTVDEAAMVVDSNNLSPQSTGKKQKM